MENKTKIILSRPSEWMNRARSYAVFIDGKESGKIKNGSSEEYLVSPGTHQLYCKFAWYSTPVFTVDIQSQQVAYILVKSGMKYYWPLFCLMFIGIITNLFYSRSHGERPLWMLLVQLVLILPGLLYMLYFLTFGRKTYLRIEEDTDNVFAS
jgi:hypothetical protein